MLPVFSKQIFHTLKIVLSYMEANILLINLYLFCFFFLDFICSLRILCVLIIFNSFRNTFHICPLSYLSMERRGVHEQPPLAKELLGIESSW